MEHTMVDADTIKQWMDAAISDLGDARLSRNGGVLKFGSDLTWVVTLDDHGRWYAHYICDVPAHHYEPMSPYWSKHRKLRSEDELRTHVAQAVDTFAPA